jgi:hypothetical protein
MQYQKVRHYRFVLVLALLLCGSYVGTANATTQSTSSHYMVTETQFGSGSALQNCSTTYCAKTSVGDTGVGSASSANYSAQLGSNTSDEPLLEVSVSGGTHDMGVLSSSTTGSAVSSIQIRNYLSNGYVLQITGTAPSQGTHTLNTLTTPSTSHQGAEQFGINLANNTSPDIGADAVQVPSGSISFGTVADDYKSADLFKYVDGDIVASSTKSSGETDYTMSLIINVSNATPGGRYTGIFSAVAVPIF